MRKEKSVAKFGGSSVIKYPQKIKEIFEATDKERNFIVVSAPGKINSEDEKLTDILIEISKKNNVQKQDIEKIFNKFNLLNINYNKEKVENILTEAFRQKDILNKSQYDALIASLGEKISGVVYANYLGAEFLDPSELFVLKVKDGDFSNGYLDFEKTKEKIAKNEKLKISKRFVVPGFYGVTEDGFVATFPRGGSDLTGAYITYFLDQDLYENFTDSAILAADPRIVENPKKIEKITHTELRDLTYSGFSILHKDVVLPLLEKNIVTEIKSTVLFPESGTMTVKDRKPEEVVLAVTGIKDFFILQIAQNGLNDIDYITSDVLAILKKYKISIEHISTGIDDFSIIINKKYLYDLDKVILDIKQKLNNFNECIVEIKKDIGLLCVSGKGMKGRVGILSKLTTVLANNEINIISINQPSSERNIIFFINNKDINKAIKEIYNSFIKI